jgi:hypothetical protein
VIVGSLTRSSSPWQSRPRLRHFVRTQYRGPAGAIDHADLVPFDAACVRPDVYYEALARVDAHLTTCIEELAALTPPELELRQLGHVLIQTRGRLRARRTRAGQLTFPLLTHTDP